MQSSIFVKSTKLKINIFVASLFLIVLKKGLVFIKQTTSVFDDKFEIENNILNEININKIA